MVQISRREGVIGGLVTSLAGVSGSGRSAAQSAPPKLDRAANLRFFYYKPLPTYDVHKAFSGFDNTPLFLVYDRLVHQDAKGDPVPGLALRWTFSDDARRVTFRLRENVRFHDGAPFDAEAVRLNINRAKTVAGSAVAADLKVVEAVKVVDPLTVEFQLSEPAVSIPLILSDRAGAMISPAALEGTTLNVRPVGAGMYKAREDFQSGVGIKLERFAEYWEPEANLLAGVDMRFNTDATSRLNALRSGSADLVGINPDQIDLAKRSNLNVTSGYDLSFATATFNPNIVPALKDERVRRALDLAVDREALVAGVLSGKGIPAYQPFPEDYFAYNSDIVPQPYDVERARSLMAEAGYKDGFDLELLAVPDPIRIRTGEALAGQWAAIGVRVKLSPIESGVMAQRYITDKNAGGQCNGWSGRADPAATLAPNFLADGWQNPGGLTSGAVTRLYQEIEATTDQGKRTALLKAISAEIAAHPLSVIPLYRPLTAVASRRNVVGLRSWISGKIELRGVGMVAA